LPADQCFGREIAADSWAFWLFPELAEHLIVEVRAMDACRFALRQAWHGR
jgi:hypothetical protein